LHAYRDNVVQSAVLIGTAGDALCADVLEVVLYVLEMLEGMRRAALYAGGCGG